MQWNYYVKGFVALLIAIVGALAVVVVGDMTLGDVTTSQWLAVAAVGLAELLAVIGLQRAPATVSTSIKE
jgi:hypothetical protein